MGAHAIARTSSAALIGAVLILASIAAAAASDGRMTTQLANPSQPEIGPPELAGIDDLVTNEMAAIGIPGLAVAVVDDGAVVYAKGFGIADDSGRPVTADSPFIIGSLSKSFTAMAAMQLVESGRIDLDARVQQYLPWFTDADRAASAQITVRDLLNQTSGLDRRTGDDVERFGAGGDALEGNVRALANFAPTAAVGTTFQYSNANYQVLGLIVAAVAGQSYGDYVQQHIFSPLEMTHSFTALAPAKAAGLVAGYRTTLVGGTSAAMDWPYLDGEVPSGYLISSAGDMAHALIAHLDAGRYRDATLLTKSSVDELHTPPSDVPGTSYAMGWLTEQLVGRDALTHSGSTPGYMSSMTIVPDLRLGVVVLTNRHSLSDGSRIAALADGVVATMLGGPWSPPRADGLFQAVRAILAAIAAWLVISLVAALRLVRRPFVRRWAQVAAIAVLGLVDVVVAVFCFLVFPAINDAALRITFMYMPDVVIVDLALGAIAVFEGVVLSALLLQGLVSARRPQVPVARIAEHAA
jgi:CubicO group peptidase (beta-lactamase class C family)